MYYDAIHFKSKTEKNKEKFCAEKKIFRENTDTHCQLNEHTHQLGNQV